MSNTTDRISLKDAYEYALESHRHASDYRAKIVGIWAALLPTGFVGIVLPANTASGVHWLASIAAVAATLILLNADRRNYPAIRAATDIGERIEILHPDVFDHASTCGQPYFSRIRQHLGGGRYLGHTFLLNFSAAVSSLFYIGLAIVVERHQLAHDRGSPAWIIQTTVVALAAVTWILVPKRSD